MLVGKVSRKEAWRNMSLTAEGWWMYEVAWLFLSFDSRCV